MNRHERRKAKVFESAMIPVSQLARMGSLCAWDGCQAVFNGDMPDGWTYLTLYWSKRPPRDILEIPAKDLLRDFRTVSRAHHAVGWSVEGS